MIYSSYTCIQLVKNKNNWGTKGKNSVEIAIYIFLIFWIETRTSWMIGMHYTKSYIWSFLHFSFCLIFIYFVVVCSCAYMYRYVHMHVHARDQCQIYFSVTIHYILWHNVSPETCSATILLISREPLISASSVLKLQESVAMELFLILVLELWS